VASEIILGGAGNFFALHGVSLRTCLLFTSLGIFFLQKLFVILSATKNPLEKDTTQSRGSFTSFRMTSQFQIVPLGFLYITVALAALRGYLAGHGLGAVFADTVPYIFFLYYFPLKQLLAADQTEHFKRFVQCTLAATIVGNALFIVFTLYAFSGGLSVLQDGFYHWFRDVAGGKITKLPYHFYRIVLNEQLLLIPLVLWVYNGFLTKTINKKIALPIVGCLLILLSINLTRIYILALGAGVLFLFRPTIWKRWLITSVALVVSFLVIFMGIHLGASRGQSLGLEIFGLRLQSIVTPALEESSLSRMLLLPKIIAKIKGHPFIGDGLADTVTVYSPVVKKEITTSQFDWGFLEIWAELGLVGLLAWASLISFLVYQLKQQYFTPAWQLGSIVVLGVITLTSPALFHVLGIVWLTVLAATQPVRASQKSSS
jgi:hypothetical protein